MCVFVLDPCLHLLHRFPLTIIRGLSTVATVINFLLREAADGQPFFRKKFNYVLTMEN